MISREKILVHACCASCSTYVFDYLKARYEVTGFYYNPNIQPEDEYTLRLTEMREVCRTAGVKLIEGEYDPGEWDRTIAPWIDLPEKSERCWQCYGLRLRATAARAAAEDIPLFTSTLSVSPHKVHKMIVAEGEKAGDLHGVRFLVEDFKKKDGFKISVEKSRELCLTRQDYCGCLPSLKEAILRRKRG
jgi:predicted adenine nucleotide alpha hydrolase (AANH) superfamily ATPase